jgi:hypothetical protein
MLLSGYTKDKNSNPIAGANVYIMSERFEPLHQTVSDEKGFYSFDLPAGKYKYLVAVKDYAEKYLEYWCENIDLDGDRTIDARFDTLEVYGLNVFRVMGGHPALMVYFRPMSLEKFRAGEADICPDITSIRAFVNGGEVAVLETNKVREFAVDRSMSAYLIQIALPEGVNEWERVDVEITDDGGAFGMATIFA